MILCWSNWSPGSSEDHVPDSYYDMTFSYSSPEARNPDAPQLQRPEPVKPQVRLIVDVSAPAGLVSRAFDSLD